MSFDLASLLKTIAPGIATALGGPGAGMAVAALSNALFGHPKASEAEIGAAIQNSDPEIILKLKQADYDFIVKQRDQEIEELKLQLADVENARNRQIQTKDETPRNLAYIITGAYFLFYACMWFFSIKPEMRDLANAFGQTLLTVWVGAMSYFLGTSVGSKSKDDVIASTLKKTG